MKRIKEVAVKERIVVIASIHQPSTATFALFSHLALLSRGKTVYAGPTDRVVQYMDRLGFPMPERMNPAEYLLDMCNVDFDQGDEGVERLQRLVDGWKNSKESATHGTMAAGKFTAGKAEKSSFVKQTFTLLHRLFLKSYRDVLAYWIRVLMYTGLVSTLSSTFFIR